MISGSYPPVDDGISQHPIHLIALLKDYPELEFKVLTSTDARSDQFSLPRVATWTLAGYATIKQAIREIKPDVIHLEFPSSKYGRKVFINFLPWLLRLQFPQIPVLLTIHEYHDASWLGRLRVLLTVLGATKTVVSNQEDYDGLKRLAPFKSIVIIPIASNIAVVHFAPAELDSLRRKYDLAGKRVVFHWGVLDAMKGIDKLLDSVKDWPEDTKLVIGAKFRPEDTYHQRLADRIKTTGGRVVWIDFPSDRDISAFTQIAWAVALPYEKPTSLRRGTMLCTLAHGQPAIITGPVRPPLRHRLNCYVIQPNSPDQIAEAVNALLSDPKLAKLIRENARTLAKHFSWQQVVKQYYDNYQDLAGSGPPGA